MVPHHGAIEKNIFHVGVVGKVLMHIFPDVMVAPAGKTLIDRVPVAIFFAYDGLLMSFVLKKVKLLPK